MNPELEAALEKMRDYKMTAREKFEQRVSFVYGMQDFDEPVRSKDEIRQMVANCSGWPIAEMDELIALRERVAVLEGALAPFAKAADARRRKDMWGSVCFPQNLLLGARAILAKQEASYEDAD